MGIGNVSERRSQPPHLGVSVVILALGPVQGGAEDESVASRSRLWLPLVRRIRQPYRDMWALPGGSIRADQSLEQAAYAALGSTTRLHPRYLEQLYTFSGPARSQGDLPMVSVAYWAMCGQHETHDFETQGNVRWFPEDELPELAFDHREIIDYALLRLRTKIEYPDIVTRLVGSTFTLRQLHGVAEAIVGRPIDLANFRRRILASGQLEETGEKAREGRQRPAAVYRYVPSKASGSAAWVSGLFSDDLARLDAQTRLGRTADSRQDDEPMSALVPHRG